MADRPFGFGLPDKPEDQGGQGAGSGSGSGAAAGDPSVLDAQRREITDAVRLADLWLDEVTAFPSGIHKIEAWSRSEWLEATFPIWAKLCDPIAAKGVEAMSGMFTADPAQ